MKKLFIVVVLMMMYLFVMAGTAKAQYTAPDDCLELEYKYFDTADNPDSVMVDTCFWTSPTYGKWYAKKYFFIEFDINTYVFKQKPIPINTRVTIDDIDSSFQTVKNEMKKIEDIFGVFYITREWTQIQDSFNLKYPRFNLEFTKYYYVDTLISFLKNVDYVIRAQLRRHPTIVNVKESLYNQSEVINLSPNPTSDFIEISLSSELPMVKIEIFSIEGMKIFETEAVKRIDVSRLVAGVYFVKVGGWIGRFVKI